MAAVSRRGGVVPSQGGGVLPSFLGGGFLPAGGRGGGGIPACTEADPPMKRMTDRCKNITLQFRCGR